MSESLRSVSCWFYICVCSVRKFNNSWHDQWHRYVVKYGKIWVGESGQVKLSNCFRHLKNFFTQVFHPGWCGTCRIIQQQFWMKESDILGGSKHTYFQGVMTPNPPGSTPLDVTIVWEVYIVCTGDAAVFWCLFNWTIFQRSSLEACRRLQTFHSPACPHIFCIQPRHNPAVSRIINSMPTPQFLETFSQPHPKIRHRHSSTFWVVLRADELTKIKT